MKDIKELITCKLQDVSLARIAYETDLSYPTLWSVLYNKHKPHLKTIKKLCKYFKVNYKEYIE